MSVDPKISVEVDPTKELARILFDALNASNVERTNDGQVAHVCVVARGITGEVLGGAYGEVYWGWLHVLVLWVDPTQRCRGLGGRLLARAEAEALSKGCRAVWLDTFTFQAQRFYLRAGYEIFGTLEQYPAGHSRHFLRKYLQSVTD
jgi:GNAT superfamily N-acetyltransferase